jgi:cell division protein FtsQ
MQKRSHSIVYRLVLVAGVTVCGFVLLSAVKMKDAKPCNEVVVHYKASTMSGFVPYADVFSLISEVINGEPVGHQLKDFDLKQIEARLEEHPWVYDAQLYFDNRQKLHVILVEAIPVARCMDKTGQQFYLDADGISLPLSQQYRADVPVFTNMPVRIKSKDDSALVVRVCQLAEAIMADSFWLAQAAQIDVLPSGRLEMIPTVGNHIVDIGFAENPDEILHRLKIFYKAVVAAGRLGDFKRLNASFERQIVAQMSETEWAATDKKEAMNTYQRIVNENKSAVDANSVVTDNAAGRIVSEAPAPKPEEKPKTLPKASPEKKESTAVEPVPSRIDEKIQEKQQDKEPAEKKVPKAIMPKIEGN